MPDQSPTGKLVSINVVEESLYEIRKKIYPRSVSGLFAQWRLILVLTTQLIFYGLPWITWNGRQAVLFDLIQRKFYIFGLVLWPQDVIYLTILLILSALSLFLFTAIAGRLFCGYACPQTVYTEIFMWIERKVEGDRFARMHLDGEEWPWSLRKWRLKLMKHFLWLMISFWTGFTFIAYFTSVDTLSASILNLSLGPWQTFWLCFYGFATWGNAGFMREQVCKYMCPYARFQSAMVDKDTFLVTYDFVRGEPRGSRNKSADKASLGLGDCVNCSICVQACPTGIDIRDGLQYMCIGCGACIDACDQVMDKLDYPKGLIRYTTERAVADKDSNQSMLRHIFRPRVLVYFTFIAVLGTAFLVSLATRNPLRVDVMRDRGALSREVDGERIENIYRIQLMNASENTLKLHIQATGLKDLKILDSQGAEISVIELGPASNLLLPIKVSAKIGEYSAGNYPILFDVSAKDSSDSQSSPRTSKEKSTFIISN